MNVENLTQEEIKTLHTLFGKLLEEPQPVVKDLDYMIKDIMNEFDFGRVETVMDALDWKWRGETPTIGDLYEEAKRLLRGAAESRLGAFKDSHHDVPIINACGGFEARAYCDEDKTKIVMLDLTFVVTSWDSEI
jgi:hypothetical protein